MANENHQMEDFITRRGGRRNDSEFVSSSLFFRVLPCSHEQPLKIAENNLGAIAGLSQLVPVSHNLRSGSLALTQVKWHSVGHFGTRSPPIPPPRWHKILAPNALPASFWQALMSSSLFLLVRVHGL